MLPPLQTIDNMRKELKRKRPHLSYPSSVCEYHIAINKYPLKNEGITSTGDTHSIITKGVKGGNYKI